VLWKPAAAGAAPLHRGDPGYSTRLDRDGYDDLLIAAPWDADAIERHIALVRQRSKPAGDLPVARSGRLGFGAGTLPVLVVSQVVAGRVIRYSADEWAALDRWFESAPGPTADDTGFQCAITGRELTLDEVIARAGHDA
jgi:hypothetical protein